MVVGGLYVLTPLDVRFFFKLVKVITVLVRFMVVVATPFFFNLPQLGLPIVLEQPSCNMLHLNNG